MKKICFLSESGFSGKHNRGSNNARVDVAWQIALHANHEPLLHYQTVRGYDYIVIILPKGNCTVNREGSPVILQNKKQCLDIILNTDCVEELRKNNGAVCYMQEGPTSYFEDYNIDAQLLYLNMLSTFDILLCHNKHDVSWYNGLFPSKPTFVLPSLIIEDSIRDLPVANCKRDIMIGGNMCNWYGGMRSYLFALDLRRDDERIFSPSMHCKRTGEESMQFINLLPYMNWQQWMHMLSSKRVGLNLMPTCAAGTFSMNCAYFSIPCIANKYLDTQYNCYGDSMSVDVDDLRSVKTIIDDMLSNPDKYVEIGKMSHINYLKHHSEESFNEYINTIGIFN